MQYVLILSPKKVILGGGVMKQKQLLQIMRNNLKRILNNYVLFPELQEDMPNYIVSPQLGDDAGITGAIILARQTLNEIKTTRIKGVF